MFTSPDGECLVQADHQRNGLGSGSQTKLLKTTEEAWCKLNITADHQRTHSTWTVKLVPTNTQRGYSQSSKVDRQLTGDLNSIGMQVHARVGAALCDTLDGLQGRTCRRGRL